MAKKNAADENANIGKALANAQKQKTGDDLIKVGEALSGMGRYADAADAIKAGIAKGVKDADNAQVRLAVALYGAKQKPAALNALDKVAKNGSANGKMIAQMWSLYIRSH
jgi:tetratricopeptide (TPR) repeat protein